MPTPVSSARQCLTDEAARALDDAVTVARRRSHSQTTSLHAVSALLSLPTSTLRDACARARSSAYSPRLQFRALELCVSVSLDRVPSSKSKTPDDSPPVSNSLMAAIKRSQANQRRHPDTFHLYQMHQQLHNSQSSLSCVKVELKHFILSILDDPIVSRVFGDAGFRSTDIKLAVLHPPPVSGFQKSMRFPPMFLCNLQEPTGNRSGFNFPFAVDHGEEDFKRIGQVLTKKPSKNPLLIGVSADNVLTGFTDSLKIGKNGFLPDEIQGLNMISIDKEISEFIVGNLSEDMINLKLKEVKDKVESCTGCGMILNFGELKLFVNGGSSGSVDYIVSQLSSLVQNLGQKLWLIGAVGSYETYMKILAKFPSLEKEWDLSLLPITSSKLNTSGSHLKSSLMGSFVPFGGFFHVPSELETASSSTDQPVSRCSLCNEKYEQEVSVIMKGGRTASVADQQSTGLASWLQTPEPDTSKGINMIEAKDHGGLFNARVAGLQRKWTDICHRLHHTPANNSYIPPRLPFTSPETITQDSTQQTRPINFFTPTKHTNTSSSSAETSITTDLDLGTIYTSPNHKARLKNYLGSAELDEMSKFSSSEVTKTYEKDFKQLYQALAEKVVNHDEPIRAISQTISQSGRHRGPNRGDMWFVFSGPDRISKNKIVTALAEVVFGSKESMVSIDLNFENQIRHPGSIFDPKVVSFSDLSFRGKTVTDYLVEELTKKPRSMVLLEHVDNADLLTQDTLARAIRTGKLSNTRGREISINNSIFVVTSSCSKESKEDDSRYSEEQILKAKAFEMRVSIKPVVETSSSGLLLVPREPGSKSPKRKGVEADRFDIVFPAVKKSKTKSCFDLNVAVEEESENENDSVFETKGSWLDEFSSEVDKKIVFKPVDFDSHVETFLKQIGFCFQKTVGPDVCLEVENEVMVQILASYWLSDQKAVIEEWIDKVLFNGFIEAKGKLCDDDESMVKLGVIEGVMVEDRGSGVGLPLKIVAK